MAAAAPSGSRFDTGPGSDPFSSPRFFESYVYPCGEWTVLEFGGELDAACAAPMRTALEAALGSTRARLVVDLSPVQFLDSSGFRAIARAGAEARARRGMLRLVCPPGVVADRLRVLNPPPGLPVATDLYSAMAAIEAE
jgi:anti-anti-sigma factor